MSEFDDLKLPNNFEAAARLAPAQIETRQSRKRVNLTKVLGKDYCIGIGGPGMIRICRVDPVTGECGYLDCVDIPRDKLKKMS